MVPTHADVETSIPKKNCGIEFIRNGDNSNLQTFSSTRVYVYSTFVLHRSNVSEIFRVVEFIIGDNFVSVMLAENMGPTSNRSRRLTKTTSSHASGPACCRAHGFGIRLT